jgi:hypothetical protein
MNSRLWAFRHETRLRGLDLSSASSPLKGGVSRGNLERRVILPFPRREEDQEVGQLARWYTTGAPFGSRRAYSNSRENRACKALHTPPDGRGRSRPYR